MWLKASDPDSKVYGANMGPTWVLSAPDGPHVGPMNLAIRGVSNSSWRLGSCHSHTLVMWQVVHQECNHDTTDKKNMINYVTLLAAVWNIMKITRGRLIMKMSCYRHMNYHYKDIIRIRRSDECLIFIMENLIPGKTLFILRRGPNHPVFRNYHYKIRRCDEYLIFIMEKPYTWKDPLHIETGSKLSRFQHRLIV